MRKYGIYYMFWAVKEKIYIPQNERMYGEIIKKL